MCIEEEQDSCSAAPRPRAAPAPTARRRARGRVGRGARRRPGLLFRFSALTFNAHRIHYDHPYATGVEGYPDLVVHGPLTAILLSELARATPRSRRHALVPGPCPAFANRRFWLTGHADGDGTVRHRRDPRRQPRGHDARGTLTQTRRVDDHERQPHLPREHQRVGPRPLDRVLPATWFRRRAPRAPQPDALRSTLAKFGETRAIGAESRCSGSVTTLGDG